MKIVDRKTFLQMPPGTVFCKFPRFDKDGSSSSKLLFSVQNPMILDESIAIDFFYTDFGSMTPIEGTNDIEDTEILMDMERNMGKEVPFEPFSSRDGLYEGDEVGFAVYSRDEVQTMIDLLQEALNKGYKED